MSRRYYSLNEAKKYKSKTKPYPFIIAHECNIQYTDKTTGEIKVKDREFYAFDDVDQFLSNRYSYPHAHEVIYDRFTDKQQGRLMFDFDFEDPWYGVKPNFVAPGFERMIEDLVIQTFKEFYLEVYTSRLIFIWLISDVVNKWSKHLIVKNAYFCEDWKDQSQIFYHLMLGILARDINSNGDVICNSHEYHHINCNIDKLIDLQPARTNATMRLCGSSKLINTSKILQVDYDLCNEESSNISFYDTMVQLYRKEDIIIEQNIHERQLQKKVLSSIFEKTESEASLRKSQEYNKYFKHACLLANIDLTQTEFKHNGHNVNHEEIEHAFEIFKTYLYEKTGLSDVFHVTMSSSTIITLKRDKPGACLLSGRVHDNSDAYMTLQEDGSIYFHCFRGCGNLEGKSSLKIGKYKHKAPLFYLEV